MLRGSDLGSFFSPLLLICCSASDAKVPARGKALINTNLSITVPQELMLVLVSVLFYHAHVLYVSLHLMITHIPIERCIGSLISMPLILINSLFNFTADSPSVLERV